MKNEGRAQADVGDTDGTVHEHRIAMFGRGCGLGGGRQGTRAMIWGGHFILEAANGIFEGADYCRTHEKRARARQAAAWWNGRAQPHVPGL